MDRGFVVMGLGIIMIGFFLFFTASQQQQLPQISCPDCNCPKCEYSCPSLSCPKCEYSCPACNCPACNCPAATGGAAVAPSTTPASVTKLQDLYLNNLRDTLTGIAFQTTELRVVPGVTTSNQPFNYDLRKQGKDWPYIGLTMVGVMRLDNVREALTTVAAQGVPGDFVECGVWRGGASIFAAGVMKAMGIEGRKVWVVDSFGGLPEARTGNDDNEWAKMEYLMVPLEKVQQNFKSFGLLGDNIEFVKGFFVDSLPTIGVKKIAVMRMDGDMYESTMDQFFNLYEKVSVGGWVIIDDWTIAVCQRAVNDFRNWHGITDKIIQIDDNSVYWIKSTDVKVDQSKYTPLLGNKSK